MKNLKKIYYGRSKIEGYMVFAGFVHLYQTIISRPGGILAGIFGRGYCKFFPSCSEYALRAIRQYGLLKGSVVSLKRIARCNPFSKGGYDPVKISIE